jgi:hypothetical protein
MLLSLLPASSSIAVVDENAPAVSLLLRGRLLAGNGVPPPSPSLLIIIYVDDAAVYFVKTFACTEETTKAMVSTSSKSLDYLDFQRK